LLRAQSFEVLSLEGSESVEGEVEGEDVDAVFSEKA
jgi:hypothetical protein